MTAKVAAAPYASCSARAGKTAASKSNSVRVVGRIRPLATYEIKNGSKVVISGMPSIVDQATESGPSSDPEVLQVNAPESGENGKRWFELDAVLDGSSTQRDVYVRSGAQKSVCENIFQVRFGFPPVHKLLSIPTAFSV